LHFPMAKDVEHFFSIHWPFVLFDVGDAGGWTRDLVLARKAFYNLRLEPYTQPFMLWLFLRLGFTMCLGQPGWWAYYLCFLL
jgi:hypothetical protein